MDCIKATETCFALLALQALVGLIGFALHLAADWNGAGKNLIEKAVHGAPIFAPLLFPNLAILDAIGLWALWSHDRRSAGR
jgi:hypothetical protein